MSSSPRRISLGTYALAFAAVLSPAWLQVAGCPSGNPNLSALEFEVDGVDQLNWVFGDESYAVTMSSPTAVLRAQTVDPGAKIYYQWWEGTTYLGRELLGTGGVEAEIDIPDGERLLRVEVEAPGGKRGYTSIEITNSLGSVYACTEAGILQAIDDGGGPHYFDCQGPTVVTTTSTLPFDNSGNVILDGEGNLTVDANGGHRVVYVSLYDTVELRGMTISGGAAPSGTGAGVLNNGTLTLTEMVITGNTAESAGGIYSTGDLTLRSTVVSGNTATNSGGAGGGVFQSYGTLAILDSTISDNTAANGAGIHVGGGQATIVDSTISGNAATIGRGGGIDISGAAVTIVNSTISGNSAFLHGDGIYSAQFIDPASLQLIATTVAGNAGSGSGEALVNNGTLATLALAYSIIEGDCLNLGDPPLAQYTIESPGDTCGLPTGAGQTNLVNVSAAELNFGPLQDNGGGTWTHAPLHGSVALDLVPESSCVLPLGGPLTVDQRGIARPENGFCDVGAVEGYCADCRNTNECTAGACDPVTRGCTDAPVADGTPCGEDQGACVGGVCEGFACTEQGILDAIAVGGGPIAFDCTGPTTVTTTAEIAIDNDVILDGEGLLTVDGDGGHRVFSVASDVTAELRGMTISGGYTALDDLYGGGGILNRGTLALANILVSNNQSSFANGGGISNSDRLTLTNSIVSGNTAYAFGGGIRSDTGSSLTLVDSSVVFNEALEYGGGGIHSRGALALINTEVSDNTALGPGGGSGGGINAGEVTLNGSTVARNRAGYAAGIDCANLTATNSVVSDNIATGDGGGIYLVGDATLSGTEVTRNESELGGGGGIYVNSGTLALGQGSTVSENIAATTGGGIQNFLGAVVLNESHLVQNTTGTWGGGLYNYSSTSGVNAWIQNLSTVSNNSAANAGGIHNTGSAGLVVSDSALGGNSASVDGGGIYNGANATAFLDFSGISGNNAINGGGIYNAGTVTVTNSGVSANDALVRGGGIYNENQLIATDTAVSGNSATQYGGGGIWNDSSGDVAVSGCTIMDNTVELDGPTTGGGGIASEGTLTVNDTVISSNAARDGGGILSRGPMTATNSTITGNSARNDGGGIYGNGPTDLTTSTISSNDADRWGAGIYSGDTLMLSRSTVANNVGGNGCGGGVYNGSAATLINATISGNYSDLGGGVCNGGDDLWIWNSTLSGNDAIAGSAIAGYGDVWLKSTVIDSNGTAADACDQILSNRSQGYNLESPSGTCLSLGGGDPLDQWGVSAEDLNLGPLEDNGGPTLTHAPSAGSFAIDEIPVADCVDGDGVPVSIDQRGGGRPWGSTCDIGAVEVCGAGCSFNTCAQIQQMTVAPFAPQPGEDIDVSAVGVDAEGDPISYQWTATDGAFADPTAAATTFTCGAQGDQTITIEVSDDGFATCLDSWTVMVTCPPPA